MGQFFIQNSIQLVYIFKYIENDALLPVIFAEQCEEKTFSRNYE